MWYGIPIGVTSQSGQRRNSAGANQYQTKTAVRPLAPNARLLSQISSAAGVNLQTPVSLAVRYSCATGRHKYHLTEKAAVDCAGGSAQYTALSNWDHIAPANNPAAHGGPGPATHGARRVAHGGPGPAVHGAQDVYRRQQTSGDFGSLSNIVRRLSPSMRRQTAGDPSSSPDLLRRLSQDLDPNVRRQVAGNENSPPGTLDRLSRDPVKDVRLGVAWNVSSPPRALRRLLQDQAEDVTLAAAENPNLPRAVLAMWQLTKTTDREKPKPQYQAGHGGHGH